MMTRDHVQTNGKNSAKDGHADPTFHRDFTFNADHGAAQTTKQACQHPHNENRSSTAGLKHNMSTHLPTITANLFLKKTFIFRYLYFYRIFQALLIIFFAVKFLSVDKEFFSNILTSNSY
jgi:hypothetical protein